VEVLQKAFLDDLRVGEHERNPLAFQPRLASTASSGEKEGGGHFLSTL
jgi:hypothetical protein